MLTGMSRVICALMPDQRNRSPGVKHILKLPMSHRREIVERPKPLLLRAPTLQMSAQPLFPTAIAQSGPSYQEVLRHHQSLKTLHAKLVGGTSSSQIQTAWTTGKAHFTA